MSRVEKETEQLAWLVGESGMKVKMSSQAGLDPASLTHLKQPIVEPPPKYRGCS
jgi:hypothetical protein